jgi:ATP adenylyltransferase/5',5'''-P-1,P-4-tetraphosphate phosphorylase II
MDTPIERKIFASFNGSDHAMTLSGLCRDLLKTQKTSWDMLAKGYEALDSVRVRQLEYDRFSVMLQFNPARIISSTAPVDKASIDKRPCFLCVENLPAAQYGIVYAQEFLILCNPYPIFPEHFTISCIKHMTQSITGTIPVFLSMARDFSPDFNLFYNGPKCGASAPDHLHFQAAPRGLLPIEKEIEKSAKLIPVKRAEGVCLFTMKNAGREVLIMEGTHYETVRAALAHIIEAMKNVLSTSDDPMNLMCSYRKNTWQVVIFPRQKHRPDVYYFPGDERILVSPGLVDMAGVIITPLEKNFTTIDHDIIHKIYEEVSVNAEITQKILEALCL